MDIREELAACYRLAAKYNLDDLVFGHISVRNGSSYLIKDPMMPFSLVTADNLKSIEIGSPTKSFSDFGIHNKVYSKIAECDAIMHIHSISICAMASSSEKLLSISQPSALVNTSFIEYEYESNLLFDGEYNYLISLMELYQFILMRNHGFITTGKSLLQVFFNAYIFDQACKIQLAARDPQPLPASMIERTRELKALLKFHQTRDKLWKNLLQQVT